MVQDTITFNNVKQTMDFGSGPVGIAGQTGVDPEWGGIINADIVFATYVWGYIGGKICKE